MKKIITTILCFFIFCSPSFASWFNPKAPLVNGKEKLNYVNISWWEKFSDPYLTCYIESAVINNHDARKASMVVEEYKEFVKYQFGQELPSITGGANYYGVSLPKTETELLHRKNIFTIPFTANYQADIFLKNHDATKSRKKECEISKFQEQSIYIALAASVATVYLNIIKYDKEIYLQQRLIRIKEEKLTREKSKFSRGVSTMLKVNEIQKDIESANVELVNLCSNRIKSLTQLAVLLGESPENAMYYKRTAFDKFEFTKVIPQSIASDVIFKRPDVLAQEAKLEKAKIDVRIAKKELFPTVNISASYIFNNLSNQNFFNWNAAIATVVAGFTQDLFKGGMKLANLRIYKIKFEELIEDYRQTDLNAIKEVNDSLMFIMHDSLAESKNKNSLNIQKNTYKRVSHSYSRGVTSYPSLLLEREKMLGLELKTVDSKAVRLADYLTLYNAVGGKL
jgi:NodT family efflux transporter outer membrane factor (OMF) lipoprotein